MTISQRVLQYNFTVNANVASTNPSKLTLSMEWGLLHTISVYVPPGHVGQTGLAFYLSGTRIIPWGGNSNFFTLNDTQLTFDVETTVNTTLVAYGYNTDQTAHTFYLRLQYTPISLLSQQQGFLPIQVV